MSTETMHDFVSGTQADLDALKRLPPNWDGYGAPSIHADVIIAAKQVVARLPESVAPRPRVVPMSNGTLQLEWHAGSKSLELEFESPRAIRFLQWDSSDGVEVEESINVNDVDRVAALIRWFMAGVVP